MEEKEVLKTIVNHLIVAKKYLESKKSNIQLYTARNAIITAIFWLEAYIK